jgi:hypothetical protein
MFERIRIPLRYRFGVVSWAGLAGTVVCAWAAIANREARAVRECFMP